jgi:hypothetical protein
MSIAGTKMLFCDTHGSTPWNGTVVCEECERVYSTHDEKLPTHAPIVCACGAQLMPDRAARKQEFSARAVCSPCFAQRVSAERGNA